MSLPRKSRQTSTAACHSLHSSAPYPNLQGRVLSPQQAKALDRVFVHPFWGLLILISILGMTIGLTYVIALPASNWLYHTIVFHFHSLLEFILGSAPVWIRVVLVEGVLAGIGTVLSFVPILLIFFTILGLLETSGYLARATRVTDRYLFWLGLPGKACIPLSMGFGCNTSAIMGCRIVEDRRARLLTMLLVPFVPCTSRLAVIALLAPAFFGAQSIGVTWGLVSINLLALAGVGFLANRIKPRQWHTDGTHFLPPYRAPYPEAVIRYVWRNIIDFLGKTRTLVLFATLAWTLSYLPNGQIETSLLAQFGRALVPLGQLAGLEDWRFIVALLASLASKENAVAVMSVLFPLTPGGQSLSVLVGQALSPAGRLAFLVIQMLFVPCASTLAAMRQETGSWRLTIIEIGLTLILSLLVGVGVYQAVALLS